MVRIKKMVTMFLLFIMLFEVVCLSNIGILGQQKVFAATSSKVIVDFVGAYPGGLSAPDISQVPIVGNADFYFALSFARDQEGSYPNFTNKYNGTFIPYWDTWSTYGLTADRIQQLKNSNSHRKFLVSVGGGDNYPWRDPANQSEWVNKAVNSIKGLINTYHLDGIDINYENDLTSGFVNAWDNVLSQLKSWNPNLVVTITPFSATWSRYKELYNKHPNNIDYINYQTYAETSDKQQAINIYNSLSSQIGGYSKLTLGVASQRGMSIEDSNTVLQSLMAVGVCGVQIWCVEHSSQSGYKAEKMFQNTFGDVKILNKASGKALDSYGVNDNDDVRQYSYWGGENQKWKLVSP